MPKNKSFLQPPLQFSGNKRFWAGELADEALLLPSGARVWDVFGGSCVDEYGGRETLQILRGCRDLMEICPFILFGDASISFWYEVLTEKYNPRFFLKDGLITGYNGKSRSEVMFSNW